MRRLPVLTLSLCLPLSSLGEDTFVKNGVFYNNHFPEASACALLGTPTHLAVGDNELSYLSYYPLARLSEDATQPTVAAGKSPDLGIQDLEAMTTWTTTAGGSAETWLLCAGSHSRTKKGHYAPARQALTATRITNGSLQHPHCRNTSLISQIANTQEAYLPWSRAFSMGLASSLSLGPAGSGAAGLNIEGLTMRADGQAVWLGLRSPLTSDGKAIILPITNPAAAFSAAAAPVELGPAVTLHLGGLGIRSIEWDATAAQYWIIAGGSGDGKSWAIYQWSGALDAPAVRLTSPSILAALALEPEGLAPCNDGKRAIVVGDGSADMPYHRSMVITAP